MTARYRQIAAELRSAIENGRYAPGALLPSITDLATRYRVSPVTVRTALALLESEGIVRIAHGTGTIVTDRRMVPVRLSRYSAVLTPGGDRGPWETACANAGVQGEMITVDVGTELATEDVATALAIEVGADVVRRDRHATIDTYPVQLQTAWYPAALVADTPLARREKIVGGVYRALASIGYPPAVADETVSCRPATIEEAAELRLRENAAVLVVERVTRTSAGLPIELLRVVADPARTRLVYDGLPLA